MLNYISFMLDKLIMQPIFDMCGLVLNARHTVNHVISQIKTVKLIHHRHIKRSGSSPFFFITPDMKTAVVSPAVNQAMNKPGITVKSEDHRFIFGKKAVEILVGWNHREVFIGAGDDGLGQRPVDGTENVVGGGRALDTLERSALR